MDCVELNRLLNDAVPEISGKFNGWITKEDFADTGSMVTYPDLLGPLMIEALEEGDGDLMHRSSSLIESLLETGDEYSCAVVCTGLFESLMDNGHLDDVIPYLGPLGKKRAHEVLAWEY